MYVCIYIKIRHSQSCVGLKVRFFKKFKYIFIQVHQANLEKLRSDIVEILDDKTFSIPKFYLRTGGEKGFRFQASLRTSYDKFTVDIPNENNR